MSTYFFTGHRSVRYHENTSSLFHALGGIDRCDTVLLESSDIASKKNTTSICVLKAALRVSCHGHDVEAVALTSVGKLILKQLCTQLFHYLIVDNENEIEAEKAVFRFPISQAADERERLQAPSNIEVLRALQHDAGYSSKSLPFIAGGFAFDYLETFENLPAVETAANIYPDYQFVVAEHLLKVDHLNATSTLEILANSAEALENELSTLSEKIAHNIYENTASNPSTNVDNPETLKVTADISDAEFRKQVAALQEEIRRGEIYQVVPARTFSAYCPDSFAAYQMLRASNPSPYMFYLRGVINDRNYELIGASPESNLKFDASTRKIQLYPIAGTRPRGLNPDSSVNHELDIRAELEMRTNTKEIAEHTMLVDLARNDLARVAVPATRRVTDLLQVDRYSRVMHLVSRVTATLHKDFDALDAYRACMNMGTLTGAPKLRAMELLRGVEKHRRGSYGGAVGYLAGDGSMDTCIVIRSAFIVDQKAVVQTGAGVVRDSQPQAEADETVHKAYAVLHALATAQNKTVSVVR
ncbi:anthranilate synthase component 1 [Corynebacterium kutscheri]|uniref:anthranilate synthase component 1 n=1 Tax=Corynebacterium kutscheri TaxID=35755 RepID=UPI0037BE8025